MIYALILGAGLGMRMKNSKIPKQYLLINRIPILQFTLERFCLNKKIDYIVVVHSFDHENECKKIIDNVKTKHYYFRSRIFKTFGGITRNESISSGIKYLDKHFRLKEDDIILTHDAVRPFVTSKIILDNINSVKKYKACTTCIKSIDTIAEIKNKTINSILDRNNNYLQQTPQSFIGKIAKNIYLNKKTPLLNNKYTDACGLILKQKIKIAIVEGNELNFKITTHFDLKYANFLVQNKLV